MLAAASSIPNPVLDWHALAPEIIVVATIAVVLVADLIVPDRDAWQSSRIASIGVLAALVPVITLAADGDDRFLFGGAYAVDHYALALKGFFLVATYVTILISVDYIGEGDYYKGEFFVLLRVGCAAYTNGTDDLTINDNRDTAGQRRHLRDRDEGRPAILHCILEVARRHSEGRCRPRLVHGHVRTGGEYVVDAEQVQ